MISASLGNFEQFAESLTSGFSHMPAQYIGGADSSRFCWEKAKELKPSELATIPGLGLFRVSIGLK